MNAEFNLFLAERYPVVRATFPGEGRRKWRLRVIEEFWRSSEVQAEIASVGPDTKANEVMDGLDQDDDDPLDEFVDGEELGLLLRTDFSDDDAWGAFIQRLQDSEKDILDAMKNTDNNDQEMQTEGNADEATESSDSDAETPPNHIIRVISQQNINLENISNLTALRLFNDVAMRFAPIPPNGTRRTNPGNRLVDRNGLQEIYTGKTIWIYDQQSNVDESVRVVSQEGDFYGTATGDSWRARAAHVPELQFNTVYYGMKVDFGGLDRWDHSERARNLAEAERI